MDGIPSSSQAGILATIADLPATSESPARARDAITGYLAQRQVDDRRLADAALVTSELVANAVDVAGSVHLRAGLVGGHIRIEVDDDGPGRPRLVTGNERGGFGLHVVDALAEEWGTELASQHKTVWAVLPGW